MPMMLRGPILATMTAAASRTIASTTNRIFLSIRICAYHNSMQPLPVMLAPPPRRVPLSLALVNLFHGFAQIGWFIFGFGMIFAWAFVGNADFSSLTFRGEHPRATGHVTRVESTGSSENRRQVIANHYEFS